MSLSQFWIIYLYLGLYSSITLQVASFGGYLLSEGILPLSFAPRDSHKAQIQFALERGVPAFVAMLGTRRLPFPAFSFDLMHCSRCLIPFTAYSKFLCKYFDIYITLCFDLDIIRSFYFQTPHILWRLIVCFAQEGTLSSLAPLYSGLNKIRNGLISKL